MGRAPCCDKANVKKGPWSPDEDAKLKEYIEKHGTGGNWIALPQKVGLRRCGKSCRLRWLNYLRPNIKHGEFSDEEDRIICSLFATIGSRWSIIAAQLPGRTDNDIKNYWNTKLKKKLLGMASPSTKYQKSPNQATTHNPFSLYTTTPVRSFTRAYHEPISPSFTTLISPNSSTHDAFVGPVSDNHNHVHKDGKNNLLIYGGEAASCSSSDGSFELPDQHLYSFQSYFSNGVDENQTFLFGTSNGPYSSANNGCLSENYDPVDCSIEEIKQLISTNNICSNNLNFFVDEVKTEEI